MKAKIIDGKKIAQEIKDEVKVEVERMVASGRRPPHLTAIQVGDDPASATYIRNKMKATQNVGECQDRYISKADEGLTF